MRRIWKDLGALYLGPPELARLPVLPKSKDGIYNGNLLALSPDAY